VIAFIKDYCEWAVIILAGVWAHALFHLGYPTACAGVVLIVAGSLYAMIDRELEEILLHREVLAIIRCDMSAEICAAVDAAMPARGARA